MAAEHDDPADDADPSPSKGRRRPLDTLERVRRELGRVYWLARDKTMPLEEAKGLTYLLSQIAAVLKAEQAGGSESELLALLSKVKERLKP
jgi:hypothetical protein